MPEKMMLIQLYADFEKMPSSLALRNAIVHLEKKLGLEPTVVPIDPIAFIDHLEAVEKGEAKPVSFPRLTFRELVRHLARTVRIWWFLRT